MLVEVVVVVEFLLSSTMSTAIPYAIVNSLVCVCVCVRARARVFFGGGKVVCPALPAGRAMVHRTTI
jgi:hypothetical protein